jgi:hypothetical protein
MDEGRKIMYGIYDSNLKTTNCWRVHKKNKNGSRKEKITEKGAISGQRERTEQGC